MSKKPTPVPTASNDDIALFLGVGDDTRRAILRHFGLPKRRRQAWSEIWFGLGLEPEQPEELWEHLTLGPKRTNRLWDAARVGDEIGVGSDTVNGYCARGAFPDGFPRPLIDHRRKTRLWLPIEVRAYMQPSIFGDLAGRIRRRRKEAEKAAPPAAVAWHGSLQPLPPSEPKA